jgi:hypothetical protein
VHAALVRLTVDPDQAPAAAEALVSDILPRVRSAPGFVAGYWLEPADGQGFSIVLFETEEQARETAPPVSSWGRARDRHHRGRISASRSDRLTWPTRCHGKSWKPRTAGRLTIECRGGPR